MTQVLAIISTLLNLVATGIYLNRIAKDKITPNPASWAIWLMVTIINLATYFFLVSENLWITLATATSAFIASLIFLFSLVKGKFTKITIADKISLIIAIMIGIVWKTTGDVVISNIALQIIFVISFIPTINGLLKKTAQESSIPWVLGSFAYVLQFSLILSNSVTFWALIFPSIQIFGQGAIALISYKNSSPPSLKATAGHSNIVH